MINVNKYNTPVAYATDVNRPAGESCVSLVAGEVVYEGKNIVKTRDQLAPKEVCMIVKDKTDGNIKYIPVLSFDPSTFDTDRFELKDWLRFGTCMGKNLMIYKGEPAQSQWAINNLYKIACDTTDVGGFHWAVTINGTAQAGDVSWAASDTLASIAAQINTVVAGLATVVEGEDFIRIAIASYSDSTLTLTNNTGATLTDLSTFCKIDGVAQAETHRTFQAVAVSTLFPTLGFMAPNTVQYGRNSLNMASWAGGNLQQYKAYYAANGSTTWVAETAGRLKPEAFAQCEDGTIGGADGIALFAKYDGSWDAYMEAGMVQIDDTHSNGIEYQSYDNGGEQNDLLAKVTTMTFDGTYVPAYPAAANAKSVSDPELGGDGHLPTTHEMALLMEADTLAAVRLGLGYLTGAVLVADTNNYWLVAEYNAYGARLYYGNNGRLYGNAERDAIRVRPVLASDI